MKIVVRLFDKYFSGYDVEGGAYDGNDLRGMEFQYGVGYNGKGWKVEVINKWQ